MQGQLPPEAQEKVEQLQDAQQKAQQIAIQKQQAEQQLAEAENALDVLSEVEEDTGMYRRVGELLVETEYGEAKEDLEDQVDSLEIRVQTLEKQEGRIREQFESLQGELQELLQGVGMGGGIGGPGGPPGGA